MNLLGLAILVVGALVLNEFSQGLIDARADSLETQADLISLVIVKAATVGEPEPSMDDAKAVAILQFLNIPRSERARLYDNQGRVLVDSDVVNDKVVVRPLPPARPRHPGVFAFLQPNPQGDPAREARAHAAEQAELKRTLAGATVREVREAETGGRLVSVSVPIQPVKAVLGALTIESGDVDRIVAAQRLALIPFILIAVGVSLLSSLLLNQLVARPVMRLARAADAIRLQKARVLSLPDIAEREDEIGDLSRALEAMTATLSARMDAIERFAADVSHEIKNPLTSIRSAVETLELAPTPQAQARLLPILKHDVGRLDRLITDISNASRLDAELSREPARVVDLGKLLTDILDLHAEDHDAPVRAMGVATGEGTRVLGREGPLGQVLRNLIDNARSFSPPNGAVRVSLSPGAAGRPVTTMVEDDGPGIPPENLESIFERFYSQRPKGTPARKGGFGGHSGLGLSIARQIVEAHGGAIRAENRFGEDGAIAGARFIIDLPAAPPAARAERAER